jgi:hypothetical protein
VTMKQIRLFAMPFGCYRIDGPGKESVLVQTDWDFPGTAASFGWDITKLQKIGQPKCDHDGTDGTVDCGCGITASEFIDNARDFLDDHEGATAKDPGYFVE